MREPWMMFTKEQGQELIDNTDSTWSTINEVNGYKFFNKTNSSRYIFLPAGGYWYGTDHYHVGPRGHYWSVVWSADDGWAMMFDSGALYMSGGYFRYFGKSIRAVRPLEW